MPIYDYKCSDTTCDGRLDDIHQWSSEDAAPKCPRCGKAMERAFDKPADILFKGLPTPTHSARGRYPKKV